MRVMAGDTGSLSGSVLLAMCDDVESICLQLVRECREMEEHFGTHFTSDIKKETKYGFKDIKMIIIEADKKMAIKKCREKALVIAKVAESPGWAKLWDRPLDLGWKSVQGLKMLSRFMSHYGKGEQPCHLCVIENSLKEETDY